MSEKQDIYNERYGVTISESGEVYIYDLETEKPKELVAEVFGQDEEAVALANLMAAAPELLQAAEEVINLDGFVPNTISPEAKHVLLKAIQKARGESNE